MKTRLMRDQVAVEHTWNLDDLFASQEAWEQELDEIVNQLPIVTAFQGQLHTGAETLLACLEAKEAMEVRANLVATYARLRSSEDGTNPLNQANSARVGDVVSTLNAALSFVPSEILALPDGTIEKYLQEEPGLAPFARSLSDLLETKPYRLSADTESAIAALGEVFAAPYTIYQRGKLSDMSFAPVKDGAGAERPVSFALFEADYEMSSDTTLRRAAYESFSKTLAAYQNSFAAVYATEVKKQTVLSRLRGFDSVTDMLLHPQQVSLELYHNILDIIGTELAPHMRRYAKLKARELGLEKLTFCDLKAPLDPEFSPPITIEEAGRLIKSALQVMGPEYAEIMDKALSERWIDYVDNVGKSTGAFCSTPYSNHSYILITWSGNMRSAFTLAHELGHCGHFTLATREQSYTNSRPSLYFIEAPSTINELLLAQHIMEQSDDPRLKRWVILQLMNTYYHNFVTHLLEGRMQRKVYEAAQNDVPLTAKKLSEWKGQVLAEFWGDTVELDEAASLTWMRQPHYYMGLYPYTYAAGLTASTAMAASIKAEGQPAVDRWLSVLKAGGTLKPLELMKKAGVDMSEPQPIRDAVAYVGSLVDELERLFEK
ncbi:MULTISPECIES: oligoendopeptidase F [Brevibacillus]|uniref:oligoendopeptidase F n=1 Tax=Brevibacillus TaxID=55080 RepID=UPI000EE6F2C7|nr:MULTISPECIES: oligoendopeptidase F [unclassified Brevibacillus]MBU8712355.1 oligoendopeptidase F [Brevibacillus parabrevis]UED71647.1 oligoendopeptidase F [Brevibacillus sp. HD3.3A]HBZ79429.1 oligoendopeptidase F [Brevibacillus sp.]